MMWLAVIAAALAVAAWPQPQPWNRPFGRQTAHPREPLRVAYALNLLSLVLASGAPVADAVDAVARAGRGEDADGLGKVAAALRWGVGPEHAWPLVSEHWRPAQNAFAISARAGAAPSTLLRQAATDLREREKQRVATAGAKAGVRIVLPLGLCFLPAFILMTIVPLVLGLVRPLG